MTCSGSDWRTPSRRGRGCGPTAPRWTGGVVTTIAGSMHFIKVTGSIEPLLSVPNISVSPSGAPRSRTTSAGRRTVQRQRFKPPEAGSTSPAEGLTDTSVTNRHEPDAPSASEEAERAWGEMYRRASTCTWASQTSRAEGIRQRLLIYEMWQNKIKNNNYFSMFVFSF